MITEKKKPEALVCDPLVRFDVRPFFGVGEITFCSTEEAYQNQGYRY